MAKMDSQQRQSQWSDHVVIHWSRESTTGQVRECQAAAGWVLCSLSVVLLRCLTVASSSREPSRCGVGHTLGWDVRQMAAPFPRPGRGSPVLTRGTESDAQYAEVRQSSAAPVDSTPRLCGADLSVQRWQLATGMDKVVAVDAIAGGDQRSGGVCRSCSTDRSSSVSTVSMPLSLHRPLPSQLGAAVLSYRVIGTCPRRGRCRTTRPAFHTTERRRRCRRRRPPCCRTHSDHSSNRRQTAGNRSVSRRQQGASSQL